jgi:hemerythrin-like domain-containing protein
MDAITLLKKDHKTVEALFKRFEKAGPKAYAEKRNIVDRLVEELSRHAAIEEQVFYPVTRRTVPAVEDTALESLEEHHVVKLLLAEIEDMDPEDERYDPKVSVLIEMVRYHVDEEEGEYFPAVREALNRTALADLGESLEEAKRMAPTHPHPRLPDRPPVNVVAGPAAAIVDRVGDTVSGIAQGSVAAVEDLVARIRGTDQPAAVPKGSPSVQRRARQVRSDARKASDKAKRTARTARSGAKRTASVARSETKRAATRSGRTAKRATKSTVSAAKR